jgi:tripeptidyl-peptidase-1
MLFRSLVAVLSLGQALEVVASPFLRSDAPGKRAVPNTHAVHERHTTRMARKWAKQEKLKGTTVLPMRIGLKQSNLDAGRDRLMEMWALYLDL